MTSLQDVFERFVDYANLDADHFNFAPGTEMQVESLLYFANETPAFDDNMPYGGMSIDREEGMFLYALTRALKPEHALEIGVFAGVSSMHILEALNANDAGDLISIDINTTNVTTGEGRWNILHQDATTGDLPPADFVFEDSAHGLTDATAILAKVKALNPRVVVSHDYYSDELYNDRIGFQVRQAFEAVFGAENVLGVKWDNAPRGFGLWLNPDWTAPEVETPEPAKKPAPRKPAAKVKK